MYNWLTGTPLTFWFEHKNGAFSYGLQGEEFAPVFSILSPNHPLDQYRITFDSTGLEVEKEPELVVPPNECTYLYAQAHTIR